MKIDEEFGLGEDTDSIDEEVELEDVVSKNESSFSTFSIKELNSQLEKAVDNENYELAAKIRDEISKRV